MKIVSQEIKSKSEKLDFMKSNYIDTNGKMGSWYWFKSHKSQNKIMVAIQVSDQLLVRKDYSIPVGASVYSFPTIIIGKKSISECVSGYVSSIGLSVDGVSVSKPLISSVANSNEAVSVVYIKASGNITNDDIIVVDRDGVSEIVNGDVCVEKSTYHIMETFLNFGNIF